jgi:hypothetical protein
MSFRLRPGDLVEVRTGTEILSSLDSNGTLDGLPFIPEMLELCGRRYRVIQRVVQAAIDDETQPLRGFRNNDVVLLEELRCSGLDHGGCQRGCMIFWREAWLSKVEDARIQSCPVSEDKDRLRSQLKTASGSEVYFCQSSEFYKATHRLSHVKRIKNCFSAVFAGNCSVIGMGKRLAVWSFWKGLQKLIGAYPRGQRKPTPVESQGLQPGEMVEVKPWPKLSKHWIRTGRTADCTSAPTYAYFVDGNSA